MDPLTLRGRRGRRESDLLGLVGWVFADLLLALTIVFIATQPGDPHAADRLVASQKDPQIDETTTTTTPVETTTTLPPGVDTEYLCFRVIADEALLESAPSPQRDDQLVYLQAQTMAEIERAGLGGRRAGVVLSFGVGPNGASGSSLAEAYNGAVLSLLPDIFGGTDGAIAARPFWDGQVVSGHPQGSIMVNVYPMTDATHPRLPKGSGQKC